MPTDAQLRAFLDESLPPDQMAAIEFQMRDDSELHRRLAEIRGQQDAGLHSLGAIWRRHRLSCPDRSTMGQYLLGVLDPEDEKYIDFHLKRVGCRYCAANIADLEQNRKESEGQVETRRQRFFQTSAGYLRRKP
jgi:anti-sigma factor RsiW